MGDNFRNWLLGGSGGPVRELVGRPAGGSDIRRELDRQNAEVVELEIAVRRLREQTLLEVSAVPLVSDSNIGKLLLENLRAEELDAEEQECIRKAEAIVAKLRANVVDRETAAHPLQGYQRALNAMPVDADSSVCNNAPDSDGT